MRLQKAWPPQKLRLAALAAVAALCRCIADRTVRSTCSCPDQAKDGRIAATAHRSQRWQCRIVARRAARAPTASARAQGSTGVAAPAALAAARVPATAAAHSARFLPMPSGAVHFGGLGISLAMARRARRYAAPWLAPARARAPRAATDANVERLAETLAGRGGAKVGQMLSFNDADVLPRDGVAMERVRDGADWMPQRQLEATLREEPATRRQQLLVRGGGRRRPRLDRCTAPSSTTVGRSRSSTRAWRIRSAPISGPCGSSSSTRGSCHPDSFSIAYACTHRKPQPPSHASPWPPCPLRCRRQKIFQPRPAKLLPATPLSPAALRLPPFLSLLHDRAPLSTAGGSQVPRWSLQGAVQECD